MPSPFISQPPGSIPSKPYNTSPAPAYSHVTTSPSPSSGRTYRLITVAGQVGTSSYGRTPSDPTEQIELAFYNLSQVLEASGATVADILSLRYYIVDYDPKQKRHAFHRPLAKFLGGYKPAMTIVPVPALASPGVVFEVECTANIPVEAVREVDVVVVGAGLSGLKAAWDVQQAGYSAVVVESRGRVGGKTWSRDSKGQRVDVGAAWINDSNQEKMWELVKHFGLEGECIVQNTEGKMSVENGEKGYQTAPYGGMLEDKEWQENVVGIRMVLEELCQKIDIRRTVESARETGKNLDGMTLEEFVLSVNKSVLAMNMVRISTRALLGVEPGDVSALYFLDYCKSAGGLLLMRSDSKHGGQYLRLVPGKHEAPMCSKCSLTPSLGVQEFSKRIAGELTKDSILLNSPVREIREDEGGIYVGAARGSFHCKRVIVSVPTPLYKEIKFDPSLPAAKVKLAESTKLGCYGKSICVYGRPWWREAGFCGLLQSATGPAGVMRDTSNEAINHYSLTCFMVGEPARRWGQLSKKERDKAVLAQIEEGFGKYATVEKPTEIVEQQWIREQWSQGCPCPVMPPGVMTEVGHALRSPAGRLHFVGTETAYEWKGYMDGAVRSGERGAAEVLQKLNVAKL